MALTHFPDREITLWLRDPYTDREVEYKLKGSTPFAIAIDHYCQRNLLDPKTIMLQYVNNSGQAIAVKQNMTPDQLSMVNGAILHLIAKRVLMFRVRRHPYVSDGVESYPQVFDDVFFKVKGTTTFRKVIKAYCERKILDPEAITLEYVNNSGEAIEITPDMTPDLLSMEDGAILELRTALAP
jgi:hypothetical protein